MQNCTKHLTHGIYGYQTKNLVLEGIFENSLGNGNNTPKIRGDCVRFDRPGIRIPVSCTDSDVLKIELSGQHNMRRINTKFESIDNILWTAFHKTAKKHYHRTCFKTNRKTSSKYSRFDRQHTARKRLKLNSTIK